MSDEIGVFGRVQRFLTALDDAKIWYRLEHIRETLMVILAIPGERWEVEFFEDGHVEIERFVSTGAIEGEELLIKLMREHVH